MRYPPVAPAGRAPAPSVTGMSASGNSTLLPAQSRADVLADALQSAFAAQCAGHQRRALPTPRPEPTPA